MKKIVSQDHDAIIIQTQLLYAAPIISASGSLYGYGIYHGETLLGSFDDKESAIEEMLRIEESTADYLIVSGYENFDDSKLGKLLEFIELNDFDCEINAIEDCEEDR